MHHTERKFRLLTFLTHIEHKHAANIQRAYRARSLRLAEEGMSVMAAQEAGEGFVVSNSANMNLKGGQSVVVDSVGFEGDNDWFLSGARDEFDEVHSPMDLAPMSLPPLSLMTRPRFGKPTGHLALELQTLVEEIALRRGATLLRRVARKAIKHDLHNNLKGVLWKRNHSMPRFQRRALYVTPMYVEGPPALCYVGPPPNNFERQIPLASILSVMFESERRLEFSIDATSRKHKLVFRACALI